MVHSLVRCQKFFLHGHATKEAYVNQLSGFVPFDFLYYVYKLRKAFMFETILGHGLVVSTVFFCLMSSCVAMLILLCFHILILILYVDGVILIVSSSTLI